MLGSPHEVHPGSVGRARDTIAGKKDIFFPANPQGGRVTKDRKGMPRVRRGTRHLTSFLQQRQRPTATYKTGRHLFSSLAEDRIFRPMFVRVQGRSSARDAMSSPGGIHHPNIGCLVLSPKSESASISPHKSGVRTGPCVLPDHFHRDLPRDIDAHGVRYDLPVGPSEKRGGQEKNLCCWPGVRRAPRRHNRPQAVEDSTRIRRRGKDAKESAERKERKKERGHGRGRRRLVLASGLGRRCPGGTCRRRKQDGTTRRRLSDTKRVNRRRETPESVPKQDHEDAKSSVRGHRGRYTPTRRTGVFEEGETAERRAQEKVRSNKDQHRSDGSHRRRGQENFSFTNKHERGKLQ